MGVQHTPVVLERKKQRRGTISHNGKWIVKGGELMRNVWTQVYDLGPRTMWYNGTTLKWPYVMCSVVSFLCVILQYNAKRHEKCYGKSIKWHVKSQEKKSVPTCTMTCYVHALMTWAFQETQESGYEGERETKVMCQRYEGMIRLLSFKNTILQGFKQFNSILFYIYILFI